MSIRVGIVGSGGTGKSGLARGISLKHDISFLQAKNITREILDKNGYQWDSGIYVEKFLAQKNCQSQIFTLTVEGEKGYKSFVTDRTSIDLAAYAIAELNDDVKIVSDIVKMCQGYAKKYTHLLFCPWGLVPLEDNRLRTLNPWYQFAIHSIMLSVLKEWDLNYYVVRSTGDKRVEEVCEFLSS